MNQVLSLGLSPKREYVHQASFKMLDLKPFALISGGVGVSVWNERTCCNKAVYAEFVGRIQILRIWQEI